MKTEIKTSLIADRKWRLNEHHGWTTLASDYGTKESYDAKCADAIEDAANNSDSQPSLMPRDEFLACDYYESQFESLKPETTHVLCLSKRRIEQFTDEAAAEKAYDSAMHDHGYERLTCDRGGHAGTTERTSISDICVTVTAPSGVYQFKFADADASADVDDLADAGVPDSEIEAVADAVDMALAEICDE